MCAAEDTLYVNYVNCRSGDVSKPEIPRQQAYVQPEEGLRAGLRAAEATREGCESGTNARETPGAL